MVAETNSQLIYANRECAHRGTVRGGRTLMQTREDETQAWKDKKLNQVLSDGRLLESGHRQAGLDFCNSGYVQ